LLQVNPESGSANGKVPNADGIEIKLLRVNGAPIDQAIGAAIDELSAGNDFIIVDPHSAGASAELQVVATLSDAAVIVVRPGHTDQNSLTDLVDALSMLETPVVGVVTNRAKETNTAARYYA
jgi:Mrp family chromosome partitioning ATPase